MKYWKYFKTVLDTLLTMDWNLEERASSGTLNQRNQRIVKWKSEKQLNSLKASLIHMIHSWAAHVDRQLRFLFREEALVSGFECTFLYKGKDAVAS